MIPYPRTLSSMVTVYAGGGMLVLVLLVGLVFFQVVAGLQAETLRDHARMLARQTASVTLDAVMIHDYGTVERLARDLVAEESIPAVRIRDAAGRELAAAGDWPEAAVEVTEPIRLLGRDYGEVELAHAPPALTPVLLTSLLIGLGGMALLSGGLFLLLRRLFRHRLIRPVGELVGHMNPTTPPPPLPEGRVPREVALIRNRLAEMTTEVRSQLTALSRANARTERATARACQEQRLAAVGQLAAGLAHGLNTPLGNIRGYAQMAREGGEAERLEALDVIERQAGLCAGVVENLMTMAHPEGEAREVELGGWLEGLAGMLGPVARRQGGASVEVAGEGTGAITVDTAALEHILFNLVSNAEDAGASRVRVAVDEADEAEVAIAVIDDGPGIPEGLRERLFDPFATTKRAGEGTGLGLYVSRNLADSLGGRLELAATSSSGTRFRLILPRGAPTTACTPEER
ncbi:His Kinase A (phospho-acceptor) domain-containing protein [Thiohalospira halophila DSM 15071]|uniref:histidine kinase n=1 Tax=Thiohalospira halophila DSM 15071 TaxID=1123397 RepID=A0A1I1TI95_9GAMM|nr:HAMP domain-containing sensor histidine kinase [Thiohalospira halophila]SFD58289.1 His Kinase A (phospho-acceptor) domain-containing protein [Thiohalospira halophila DSM 15071]